MTCSRICNGLSVLASKIYDNPVQSTAACGCAAIAANVSLVSLPLIAGFGAFQAVKFLRNYSSFSKELNDWLKEEKRTPDREKAALRIEQAYRKGLSTLNIEDLHLTSLPTAIRHLHLRSLCAGENRLNMPAFPSEWEDLRVLLKTRSIPLREYRKICTGLDQWSKEEGPGEKKEACDRIWICYQQESNELDLSSLGLESLPKEIWSLSQLTHLDLSDNPVSLCITDIEKLSRLQTLDITYTPIPVLAALTHLRHVTILAKRNNAPPLSPLVLYL